MEVEGELAVPGPGYSAVAPSTAGGHGSAGAPRLTGSRVLPGVPALDDCDIRRNRQPRARIRPVFIVSGVFADSEPVPGLDILGLAGQWPGHAAELTGAVITAAVLGAVNARHLARELLDEAIGDTEIPQQIKRSLCLQFMRLDRSAAEHATRIARQTLGQLDSADATASLT